MPPVVTPVFALPALSSAQRAAALAVQWFETPAAVVLRRHFDGWQLVAAAGPRANPLTDELLRCAFVLDTGGPFILVPDLEDDPRLSNAIPASPGEESHLRFLAGSVQGLEGDALPMCLCLLDVRPRQLRTQERQSLSDLAALIAPERKAPPPPAPPAPPDGAAGSRTADMIALPPRPHDIAAAAPFTTPNFVRLEERLRDLTRANEALRAELGDRSQDALEHVRFRQLVEESSDCVGLASLDGKMYYLNAAGQRLLGLDNVEDVKRTRIIDYLMREDRSFFLGTVLPNLTRNTHWEGDFRFRNFKTGASIEVSWNLFLLRDGPTSEPAGIAIVTRDITERKKAEVALRESEERFRHLVEQAGEAFFVYDLSGRIMDVNQEACDTLGYPKAELLALSVQDVEAGFDPIKGRERWKQMVPGVAVTMTASHRRKDGSEFPVESRVAVFRSGTQRLLLALVRDITDRKRADDALQQNQEELEKRVQERTTELARANDDLRRSEVRIARMTANVPGMVYQLLLRPDGTASFPYVSEGCREMFGLDPAQMRPDACTLLDLIHEEDIGEFLRTLDVSRTSGEAWVWEGRYYKGEKRVVHWLQGGARPENHGNGDTLWDGLLLDVTTRKRAEQKIQDGAHQAAAVAGLGQHALTSAVDLPQTAVEVVARTLGVEIGAVVELLPGGKEAFVRATAGLLPGVAGRTYPAGEGSLSSLTIKAGGPVISEDLAHDARFDTSYALGAGAVSGLSVVIQGRDQPLGVLCVAAKRKRAFTPEDINFLQAVANVLASTIDRSRDEQALRQSEGRNAAILETALDPIITIDHQDRIVEFNPAAEKTFGYDRTTALGRAFTELVPEAQGLGSRHPGERVEMPARHANGSQLLAELSVARIPVEGLPVFTAYLRDITARKHAEEALRAAKEEAERANNAKSEFLSRMSHELRTPLNAILGFGQLLQMQQLAPAQHDRIGHIVNAGRHLLGLINEVLDIARIEAGRVELSLEPVRVADTVTETLELIRPLAAERGVTLHPVADEHPLHQQHVMADRQRFKQVLLNLLSNAVKYNREQGSVRLEYAEGADGRMRLTVSDTGPGVPPDKLARLFVAFDRLGAEHSAIQGTGLGLALSKRLIDAMGGTVGADSVHGEGARFWIELPKAESQLELVARRRQDGDAPADNMDAIDGAHHVLYVEDNLSNLTLIEHLLTEHPTIKLMTAMQGGLGLDLARKHLPDLILLDLHLPDLPGWDVLAALQADPATRDIPVVVVSADATSRQIEKLMKAGARAYLTKPLEVDRFQRVLHQFLDGKKL